MDFNKINKNVSFTPAEMESSRLNSFLDIEEIQKILAYGEVVEFHPNEVMLKQGATSNGILLIIQGEVRITARNMGEGVTKIDKLGPGFFMGESSFIEGLPISAMATAATKVKCLFISPDFFSLLSNYYPQIQFKIIREIAIQICQRLRRMHDKVTDIINHSDMVALSFLGRVIHSLTQPKQSLKSTSQINVPGLRNKGMFKELTEEETYKLLNKATLIEAAKNCILIHEHTRNAECYIVLEGAVQSSIMEHNKLAKLSVIGPGSLFASVGCIDQSDFTMTFITCEAASLLKLTNEELDYFEKYEPIIWYKLFNLICGSLVALGRSINKLAVRLNIEIYNR